MKMFSAILTMVLLLLVLTACGGSGGGSGTLGSTGSAVGTGTGTGGSPSNLTLYVAPVRSGVPTNAYVTIAFSEVINSSTVDVSSVYITDDSNNTVAANLTVSDRVISIVPNDDFFPLSSYTLVVTTAVQDIAGRRLMRTFTLPFTTATLPDLTAPSMVSFTPGSGTITARDASAYIEFDEFIDNNSTASLQLLNTDTHVAIGGQSSILESAVRFIPDSNLSYDGNYTVTLSGTVTDLSGNAYVGPTSWNFSVESAPASDVTPPSFISFLPADGASVPKSTGISMEFSEAITDNGALLQVVDNNTSSSVTGSSAINGATISFIPDTALSEKHNYTVTLSGTVTDLSGNAYVGPTSWSFSTIDSTAPSLLSLQPADNTSTGPAVQISMTFSEAIANTADLNVTDINNSGAPVPGTSSLNSNTLRFAPDSNLTHDHSYLVQLNGSVKDLSGNNYSGTSRWTFSINPAVDATPPVYLYASPANGATADKTTSISIAFDETLADNGALLQVTDTNTSSSVSGSSAINGNALLFVPDSNLTAGHSYSVFLPNNSVEDLSHNVYSAGPISWNFTVKPDTVISNTGYKQLLSQRINFNEGTRSMAIYHGPVPFQPDAYHIVVGTLSGIRLYRVEVSGGYPSLVLVHTYPTPSRVITLDIDDIDGKQYILAGTLSDGLYVIDAQSDSSAMELRLHYGSLGSARGVSYARTAAGNEYLYAASVSQGLGIFEVQQGNHNVNYLKSVDLDSELMDVTALSNQATHRIYVATEIDKVKVLFEDGSLEREVTVPGDLKDISYGDRNAAGDNRIYITTKSAKVYDMDLAGNLSGSYQQTFTSAKDFTTYTYPSLGKSYSYLSDGITGVLVRSLSDANDVSTLSAPGESIAANAFEIYTNVSVLDNSGYLQNYGEFDSFVAVLDRTGYLGIYNGLQDLTGPTVISAYYSGSDVTVIFDEYLDPATVTQDDFSIRLGGINMGSISNFKITDNKVVTFTFNYPIFSIYDVRVSGAVTDRIGNSHHGGTAYDYSF